MSTTARSSKLHRIDATALSGNTRATLSSWLRYKPMVEAAMKLHPRPYIYTCNQLTPASVSSKIRDAIRGAIAFGYEESLSPGFTERLIQWYGEIIIKVVGNTVVFGPPSHTLSILEVEGAKAGSTNALTFETLGLDEISAFSLLLSHSRINGPIIVRHPPNISLLDARPNVEVLTPEDGSLVLL